jgi:hypothetical protein
VVWRSCSFNCEEGVTNDTGADDGRLRYKRRPEFDVIDNNVDAGSRIEREPNSVR